MEFTKATKKKARLRMAVTGPAGSGKTYSALAIASAMGGRTALVDTEHGSASKYADLFDFDTLELDVFAPAQYVMAIRSAEQAGYDNLVIDSLSHGWMGKGGALEMVGQGTKKTGNSYTAWGDVTPEQNSMVEAILGSKCHLFATMRSKMDYVLEQNSKGKQVPRAVGLAPVQRDGIQYEFDVIGDLNLAHVMSITKTRCPFLEGKSFEKPGKELADILLAWLTDGADMPKPPTISTEQTMLLMRYATEAGLCVTDQVTGEDTYPRICEAMKIEALAELPLSDFARCEKRLKDIIRENEKKAAAA